MKKKLICIQCPLGCQLEVDVGSTITVKGNSCPRGVVYAEKELTNPTRTVTSTISVTGGELRRVSVKTADGIPKDKIMECMREIRSLSVSAPVHMKQVILKSCAGTGIPLIATKEVRGAETHE